MSDKDTISTEFTAEEKALLCELEAKHKRIIPFKVKGVGLVVIRKPTRPEWKKHQALLKAPQVDELTAEENFTKQLTVHPAAGASAIDAVLDDYPAMDDTFRAAIRLLASGDNSEVVGSLGKDWREPGTT